MVVWHADRSSQSVTSGLYLPKTTPSAEPGRTGISEFELEFSSMVSDSSNGSRQALGKKIHFPDSTQRPQSRRRVTGGTHDRLAQKARSRVGDDADWFTAARLDVVRGCGETFGVGGGRG